MASERLYKAHTISEKLENARDLVREVCSALDEEGHGYGSLERLAVSLAKAADTYRRTYLEILAEEINIEDLR